jgi:hypothetical protein
LAVAAVALVAPVEILAAHQQTKVATAVLAFSYLLL